jgi:lipopolysaccharide biosynthesis protein
MTQARLIAFYLPQYHPIPENDAWWGKGFTEWTNVAKAKPLFRGHHQPHVPADLGFYDLRVPEVRELQALMARQHGIEGFCYWHYWFGGKQLLETPIEAVLSSGKPDFPFCLAWANQSWTGIWHGLGDQVLIRQTYPGKEDHIAHFNALLPAFSDARYIRVDGKPVFAIYKPKYLPEPQRTLELWNNLAIKAGFKGLFFIGVINEINEGSVYKDAGFDAFTLSRIPWPDKEDRNPLINLLFWAFSKQKTIEGYQSFFNRPFNIYDFAEVSPRIVVEDPLDYEYYPCVVPNWDNTPRSGVNGFVAMNASPLLFKRQVSQAVKRVQDYPPDHRIIFVKSWNEWAEGNYLEPDLRFGHQYLQALQEAVIETPE